MIKYITVGKEPSFTSGLCMLIISYTRVVRLDCSGIFDHMTGSGRTFYFCVQMDNREYEPTTATGVGVSFTEVTMKLFMEERSKREAEVSME